MSVNTMSYEQIATVLNDIYKAVTGKESAIAPKNTAEFTSVATTVLEAGYDPVMAAISGMVSKTIFSNRPYNRKFKGLEVDSLKWGARVRKIQFQDREAEDNEEFKLIDGESIDPFKINMPKPLETNFYGFATYARNDTTFLDQLNQAFKGPEQLGEFMAAKVQNISDQIEQDHESLARMCVANFMGGKIAADNGIFHCLTEYAEETGVTLDQTTVFHPDNFLHFTDWLFNTVERLSKRMAERTQAYQIQVEGKEITRHTPQADQRIYLYDPLKIAIDKRVLANTYHDNYLKFAENEGVTFWQNFMEPTKLDVTPAYMKPDGTIEEASESVTSDYVIGVMFDRDAMGYTVVNEWAANSPLNQRGGYYNTSYHYTDRYYNDFTEKGIILTLD